MTAGVTAAIIGLTGVLLMIWLVAPGSTLLGLPTADSFKAITDGISEAKTQFGVAIAPTPPVDGFTMALVFAVTALAGLADWALKFAEQAGAGGSSQGCHFSFVGLRG